MRWLDLGALLPQPYPEVPRPWRGRGPWAEALPPWWAFVLLWQELTPDYSMESHQRDHENYVACSRSHRRRAKALLDFERHDDDELGFRKNDIITVRGARLGASADHGSGPGWGRSVAGGPWELGASAICLPLLALRLRGGSSPEPPPCRKLLMAWLGTKPDGM